MAFTKSIRITSANQLYVGPFFVTADECFDGTNALNEAGNPSKTSFTYSELVAGVSISFPDGSTEAYIYTSTASCPTKCYGPLTIPGVPTPTATPTNTPTATPNTTPTNTPSSTPTSTPTNTPTVVSYAAYASVLSFNSGQHRGYTSDTATCGASIDYAIRTSKSSVWSLIVGDYLYTSTGGTFQSVSGFQTFALWPSVVQNTDGYTYPYVVVNASTGQITSKGVKQCTQLA